MAHQVEFRCNGLYVTGYYQNGQPSPHFFRIFFVPCRREFAVALYGASRESAESFYQIFADQPDCLSELESKGEDYFFRGTI